MEWRLWQKKAENWKIGEQGKHTLKQGRAIEDTSGQVTRVDASEAVWEIVSQKVLRRPTNDQKLTCLSSVTTNAYNARVSCVVDAKVHEHLGDCVLASWRAAVPVVRNTFVAAVESEAARLARDGEERLQRLAVQSSAGGFGAVVGHEVDHEVVRSRRDETAEGTREVVGVVQNGPPGV
jgi:hypothetical protein